MHNIGMVLDAEFPPDPRVENEAKTLLKQGHKVYLFCFGFGIKKDERFDYDGIIVLRKKCPNIVFKLSALAYTLPIYHLITHVWIKKFITKEPIDVLHVHDMQIVRAAEWANNKNLPIVLDLHENRPEIMKFYSHVNSKLGQLLINPQRWKFFEFKSIKKASHVVVVTEEAKEYYEKKISLKSDKIIAVPNTVRSEFYSQGGFDDTILNRFKHKFAILYVGDTGIRRGLLTAIEAVSLLKEEIPNIHLVIVGKNKTDEMLKERVSLFELEEYVSFEGWQGFQKFPSYIESSRICISPLYRNIHHDTTYANKLFQYMSMGKPVLVSDCPAQANVIKEAKAGIVFKAERSQEMADAIKRLYQQPDMLQQMGDNGKLFVRNEFSWEKTSKKLVDLYEKI